MEAIEREVAFATRHNHTLSLVMFDIDHFKDVNIPSGIPWETLRYRNYVSLFKTLSEKKIFCAIWARVRFTFAEYIFWNGLLLLRTCAVALKTRPNTREQSRFDYYIFRYCQY